MHFKRKPMSAAKFYLVSKKPELPYWLLWDVSIRWECRKTMACLKRCFVLYVVYVMCVTPNSTLLSVWSWASAPAWFLVLGHTSFRKKVGNIASHCSEKYLPLHAVSICQFCPWGYGCPSNGGLALMGPVGWDLTREGGHHTSLLPHAGIDWGI